MSLAGPVTVDLDSKAPVLEHYARAPVLIDKVRRLPSNAQSK
jgi:hypothetical protein